MSTWGIRLLAIRGFREWCNNAPSEAARLKYQQMYTDAMRTIAAILIEGSY